MIEIIYFGGLLPALVIFNALLLLDKDFEKMVLARLAICALVTPAWPIAAAIALLMVVMYVPYRLVDKASHKLSQRIDTWLHS